MNAAKPRISSLISGGSDFLKELSIEHGPIELLGRFFLRATSELAKLDLEPVWLTAEELQRTNRTNADSWMPMVPTFDIEFSQLGRANFRAVGIRRADGTIVGAHALRYFDWTGTTYGEELSSYRLFYADPAAMKLPQERCTLTAGRGASITGKVAFSGAAWYHPSVRKLGLSHIVPRLGKAVALATWPIERIVALMTESVFASGFAPRFGYHDIDWGVIFENAPFGTIRFALIWIDKVDLELFLESYTKLGSQIDSRVLARDTDEPPARAVKQGEQ